jgi:thiosulfate dehydrogenase
VFNYRTYATLVVSALVIGAFLPVAIASRSGADIAYNGGVQSMGSTCFACHAYNAGNGRVELLGVPPRYRAGAAYELSVRVSDSAQAGAGFEVSAENEFGHQGTLIRTDIDNTDFSPSAFAQEFLTHTGLGVDDSVAQWAVNGGSYEYHFAWQAPTNDVGRVTLFAAGNAINDAQAFFGDRYYSTDATIGFARPGDADGDDDADLLDYSMLSNCVGESLAPGQPCDYVDADSDGDMTLDDLADWILVRTGPTAIFPAGFVVADPVRGGRLYDNWWEVSGAAIPIGDHPLYPAIGVQTGPVTFRCKECHGWDYKGVGGRYASGSHFTGIRGVFGTTMSPREIFELLKADPAVTPGGHNMDSYGMIDRDLWDVVRMTVESVVDTDDHIAGGAFLGDDINGSGHYFTSCLHCHGEDGTLINFGTPQVPEYVGTVAVANPWEFLHKIRFGHPGASMPAFDLLRRPIQDSVDVGAFSATLPTE